MSNNQTITINSGGTIVVTNPDVIISGVVPASLTWDTTLYSTYNIFNNTSGNIRTLIPFIDVNGNVTNYISPNTHFQVTLVGASWIQAGMIGDASTTTLSASNAGNNNGGSGPNGQIQSDWTENNAALPSYIRNKPAIPEPQEQSDWNEVDASQPDYIKNKPSIPGPYTLPAASTIILGGIKVGANLSIDGNGVLNAPSPGSLVTSMPTASSIGINADGTDQTSAINAALANNAYSGISFDYSAPAAVTVNGTISGQGKTLRFQPGNTIIGSYTVNNFILDCGLRQKCFDIGSSGSPTGIINPIGTTLSVISPWVFGARSDGSDISRPLQCTVDMCIRNGSSVSKIIIPSGGYLCNNPIIEYLWNGSGYGFHQITIDGEANFAEASGYGTYMDFSARKDAFAFGIQKGKGSMIRNIKITGGFNYSYPGDSVFYNLSYAAMTDGVSRDTTYSPNSGIVVDPFGNTVPADGGYPGNDAYGNPLSGYYRGSGVAGSTGCTFDQIFLTNWVVGIITSPNGQTQNAELIGGTGLQIVNTKTCIAGCQDQEKLNTFRRLECWGVTYYVFSTGLYGAGSIGAWWIDTVNIAGKLHSFLFNSAAGYFPSYFANVYAETLGNIGFISSHLGTTIMNSTFNFITPSSIGSYIVDQVSGNGVTFIGCQFRMYGTTYPVTINNSNGRFYFRDCSFDVVPIYSQDYPGGTCGFSNCTIFNLGSTSMNPTDMQVIGPSQPIYFSYSNAYGSIKIRSGTALIAQRTYTLKSVVAALRMPITRSSTRYTITTSVVSGVTQAVITCVSDELNRVFVGDIICGDLNGDNVANKVIGVVVAAGSGTFTVRYIPTWVTSGSLYFLFVWLPLRNISFIGDTTSGSTQITNVAAIDGSLTDFAGSTCLIQTKSFKPNSDSWSSNLIRVTGWNSGTNTLNVDKVSLVNSAKVLFTNTDAEIDPTTPSIVAGSASGSSPTLSIVKGNDKSHQVSITTGTGPSTGLLATISFLYGFAGGYVPCVKFSPANGNAAALSGATQVYMDTSVTSSYIITSGSAALAASTLYLFNVEVN